MRVDHALALGDIAQLVSQHLSWDQWDAMVSERPPVIDRPRGSHHPTYPSIIYPIDYGYIPGTLGSDGEPVDLFLGTGTGGVVAAILTIDYRRRDREVKLLYNCTPEEIYIVNGFINFDPSLMRGRLAMRTVMTALW